MPIVRTNNDYYSEIAGAIRAKTGESTRYKPSEMAAAIAAIEGGLGVTGVYPVTVAPTGDTFTVTPDDGLGFSEVTIEGDPFLSPENIPIGVTIYGVEGKALPGTKLPDEYLEYVEYAMDNLYNDDYANMMVLDYGDWIAVSFLMSDFEIKSYNSTTTEFTATGWFTCGYTKSTGEWTATDFTSTTSTGGNYIRHIKFASCYLYYLTTLLYPVGGGATYWAIGSPTVFTLDKDKWNGTSYSLVIGQYDAVSNNIQLGVPPQSSMYNADIVTKCAMTIPKISYASGDNGRTYTVIISAVNVPVVDVQIAIWGLS